LPCTISLDTLKYNLPYPEQPVYPQINVFF